MRPGPGRSFASPGWIAYEWSTPHKCIKELCGLALLSCAHVELYGFEGVEAWRDCLSVGGCAPPGVVTVEPNRTSITALPKILHNAAQPIDDDRAAPTTRRLFNKVTAACRT